MRLLFCSLFILTFVPGLRAQDITGIWEARTGKSIWIFNITNNGRYETLMDDPEHDLYGIATQTTQLKKDSIFIDISLITGVYKAKWNHRDSINGKLILPGSEFNINFKRISPDEKKAVKITFNRPQTPKPPFNYVVEDLEYSHGDMHYGATFTKPSGSGKFPTVLIVNGFVLEDRNGNMYAHKSYWVLADYLTRNGFAVLRVDSRGLGKTSLGKKHDKLTPKLVSFDLKSGLDYLKTRPDVDLGKLGLVAQGNGGMPAEIIAAKKRAGIKFLVLWGVPAIDGIQREILPSIKLLTKNRVDTASISAYVRLKTESLQALLSADSETDIEKSLESIFFIWNRDSHVMRPNLNRYVYDVGEYSMLKNLKTVYNSPQWLFNIAYKPQRYIERIKCPVLLVIGDRDTETPAAENLNAMRGIIDSCGKKNIEMRVLPGLNHLLQTADTGEVAEYMTINETIAPSAMKIIADWIKIHAK